MIKIDNYVNLVGVIFLWYVSSIITIISSKLVLNSIQFPYLLGSSQFIVASICSLSYLYVFKLRKSNFFNSVDLHMKITISYVIAVLIFNLAITQTSPNFIELIRTMEPVTSSILGCIYLSENISIYAYIAIIPMLGGIFLSFDHHLKGFHIFGLILAMICNLFYSIRNVHFRIFKRDHEDLFEQFNIYADMHLYGLFLFIPITILMENHMIKIFYDTMSIEQDQDSSILNIKETDKNSENKTVTITILLLILLNTFCYTCETLMSNIILEKTDLIAHSVLNTFRRVFTMWLSALYFNIQLSYLNIISIIITILSVGLFGYFKINHNMNIQ